MVQKFSFIILPLLFFLGLTGCSPSVINSQLQFGIQAAQNDLWDEAIFRWKKAVELNPESAAAHNNLAVAFEKKGLWEEASEAYEVALKLNPNNRYIESNYQNFKERLGSSEKEKAENKK